MEHKICNKKEMERNGKMKNIKKNRIKIKE